MEIWFSVHLLCRKPSIYISYQCRSWFDDWDENILKKREWIEVEKRKDSLVFEFFCDVGLFDGNNHELLLINECNLYYYKRKQNVDQRKEIIENIFVSISIVAFKNRNIDVIMPYLNDSNK